MAINAGLQILDCDICKKIYIYVQLMALQSRESSGTGGMINLNKENEVEAASWSNGSDQENSTIDMNLLRLRTASADSCAVLLPSCTTPPLNNNNNNNHKNCSTIFPPTTPHLTHLLQGSQLRPAADLHQPTSDEGLCNMFNAAAIDQEQPGFWPWSTVTDQPHPTFIN